MAVAKTRVTKNAVEKNQTIGTGRHADDAIVNNANSTIHLGHDGTSLTREIHWDDIEIPNATWSANDATTRQSDESIWAKLTGTEGMGGWGRAEFGTFPLGAGLVIMEGKSIFFILI